MRDLSAGEKTKIKAPDFKFINVPNYTGLNIEKMIEFAKKYPLAMNALPVEDEIKGLHRQYLANVIYTTVGKPF